MIIVKKKVFLLMFLVMLLPIRVLADTINKIDMKIKLLEDGTAEITEVWDVIASGGSEWYKQLYNLGESQLSDFKVSMDGEALTYKSWNVNETLLEKKGYYGINYVSEGLELCFGKGDMKRHTFNLEYKLSNYVFNTDDSQVLYWTLFPNVTLDNFTVEVSSYYEFPDTLDVWGYGYKGYAYVKDGIIQMSNEDSLNGDYVSLLVKFPKDTFKTEYTISGYDKFETVLNRASENTYEYEYDYDNSTKGSSFRVFFEDLLTFIKGIFPIAIVIFILVFNISNGYGYAGGKVIYKREVPMFRDIPCNKDIYYANCLISLNNFNYNETNILGAIILKWLRKDKISFKNEVKGIFNKETTVIDLTKEPKFDNELEEQLFNMMYKASKDGFLETKELEKWCKKNYDKFFSVFKEFKDNEINKLKEEGHIYKRKDRRECKKRNVMDEKIYNDSVELYGLKLYLQEFASMDKKEAIEVKLWDEYLMFAYLFGIADKVAKQLKNIYPEVLEQDNFNYDTIVFVNNISAKSVMAASSARSAATEYSGGGGGFSSGGGGGGSFGGGGSMGGR